MLSSSSRAPPADDDDARTRLQADLEAYLHRHPCVLTKAQHFFERHPSLVLLAVYLAFSIATLLTRAMLVELFDDKPRDLILSQDNTTKVTVMTDMDTWLTLMEVYVVVTMVAYFCVWVVEPGFEAAHDPVLLEARSDFVYSCQFCDRPRSPRAHHCRVCDRCVAKRDHHCPWVSNCVGLRNQRNFTVFTGNTLILALYAVYITLRYFFFYSPVDGRRGVSELAFFVNLGIAVPAAAFVGQLFMRQLYLIRYNLTGRELADRVLGVKRERPGPQGSSDRASLDALERAGDVPPPADYDKGALRNFQDVFGRRWGLVFCMLPDLRYAWHDIRHGKSLKL